MAEKTEFSVLLANYDEANKTVTILANPTDGGSPATTTIHFEKWDDAKKKYFADDEAAKAAEERLASMNLTLDQVKDGQAEGVTFESYAGDGKLYVNPPRKSFDLSRLTYQDTLSVDGTETVTVSIFESKNTKKFMIFAGIPVSVGKGAEAKIETKYFKVSQLRYLDPENGPKDISVKYTTKEIANFEEQLSDETINATVKETIQKFVEESVVRAREAKIKEIKDKFGFDITEMIESGDQIELKLKVKEISGQDGTITYFLAGQVLGTVAAEDLPSAEEGE